MYIVFEWIDGSGKDTQLKLVLDLLIDNNKYNQVLKTQEPSGNWEYWRAIKEKLKGEWFKDNQEALYYYVNDRIEQQIMRKNFLFQNWENKINKKNNSPKNFILSSRGDYTTYAYQTLDYEELFSNKKPADKVKNILKKAKNNKKSTWNLTFKDIYDYHKYEENWILIPDITFFFDVSWSEALNRINKRNWIEEEIEKNWEILLQEDISKWDNKVNLDFFENANFLEKARNQYLEAFKFLKKKQKRKIIIIDTMYKSIEDIHQEVKEHLEKYINL